MKRIETDAYLTEAIITPLNQFVYLEHGKNTPLTRGSRQVSSTECLSDLVETIMATYPDFVASKASLPDLDTDKNLYSLPKEQLGELTTIVISTIKENLKEVGLADDFFTTTCWTDLSLLIEEIIKTAKDFVESEKEYYRDTR